MDALLQPVWDSLFLPFAEFAFMRRALVATLALSLSAAPLGVFLTLRRMSLLGDALSHAVLPGVAIGFMVSGLSLTAMALGGVVAGMLVAGIAGVVSRFTTLKEDASLAAIYLVALALGVTLISRNGTQVDLLHILFGSALGVDNAAAVCDAVRAKTATLGGSISREAGPIKGGNTIIAFITDPDGYKIELIERPEAASELKST